MLRTSLLALRRQLAAAEAAGASSPALLGALQALLQQQGPPGVSQQQLQSRAYAAPRRQGRPAPSAAAATAAELAIVDAGDDEPAPELRLPDLSDLGGINPRLRDVMLQHQSHQKSASAVEVMMAAVEAAHPEAQRAQRLSRTGLRRLRVDALRQLLEQLGGDSRGTKEALVQRLLDMAGAEERAALAAAQQQAALQSQQQLEGGGVEEGVVSRRLLAAQQQVAQRMAAVAARGGSYGVPDASLRQAHRAMVQPGAYSQVFDPQEVADLLADARAEDICVIDVRGRCPFTDYMVLATARSQRLASMLAGAVLHALKARAREVAPGVSPTIEGALDDSEWQVVDAGSVVVHVFLEGYRQEYALEELWGGAAGEHITRVAPKPSLHTLDTMH